jgi:hypothetical protein
MIIVRTLVAKYIKDLIKKGFKIWVVFSITFHSNSTSIFYPSNLLQILSIFIFIVVQVHWILMECDTLVHIVHV